MHFRSLRMLLWKHVKVRLRKYFSNVIELISPVFLMLLIFIVVSSMSPGREPEEEMPPTVGSEPFTLRSISDPQRVMYTPKNKFTKSIMLSAGQKLDMVDLETVPRAPHVGMYGTSNETIMENYVSNIQYDEAVVIFQDTGTEGIPKLFNYSIQIKNNFMTKTIKPGDDSKGPHPSFVTDYQPFMRLQWALDSSYLQMATQRTITQELLFEELPSQPRLPPSPMTTMVLSSFKHVVWMSLLMIFVLTFSRLQQERGDGIRELLKLYGVSPTTIDFAHFLNALPAGVVYSYVGIILVKVNKLVVDTNMGWILLFFILHYVYVVSMAFPCSYTTSGSKFAVTLSFLMYVCLYVPAIVCDKVTITNKFLLYLSGLLPNVPIAWFWNNLLASENEHKKLPLTSSVPKAGPPLLAFACLLIQTAAWALLAWYLERVRPGKYGVARPWYFIFQSLPWLRRRVEAEAEDDSFEEMDEFANPDYFEQPPVKEVGIHVENVVKDFGSWYGTTVRALAGVSFDVYRGEITVLLGHNGCGKTTIMNIITGMYSPTRGSVRLDARRLGLCPQHNLNFRDLTVFQHVVFFTILKGGEATSVRQLLSQLGLAAKASSLPAQLSGGMLRRLQLACALAGDSDALLLDEPTSGLDVATRRSLWNLLLSLRGERTVLLTTHFMEEADALGDRVLLMSAGRLRCHATPMYLKKAIGSGYRLTVGTDGPPREEDITAVVTSSVPDASVQASYNTLSYALPAARSERFPTLFAALEGNREALGIASIGVGVTTLEEVFLQLCKDTEQPYAENDVTLPDEDTSRTSGLALLCQQSLVLFKRQFLYTKSHWLSFFIVQFAVPVLMIYLISLMANNAYMLHASDSAAAKRVLDPVMYSELDEPKAFYRIRTSVPTHERRYADSHRDVQFTNFSDAAELPSPLLDYLFGLDLNDTHFKLYYTSEYRHAAPVALNYLSNVLAPTVVAVYNDPAPLRKQEAAPEAKATEVLFLWASVVVCLWLVTAINASALACAERSCGSRHIHIMSGCPVLLYWLVALLYNVCLYTVTLVVPTVFAAALLDKDNTFQGWFLGALLLCGALSLAATVSLAYLLSFYVRQRNVTIILIALIFVFGIITPPISMLPDASATARLIRRAALATPPHAAVLSVLRAGRAAARNARCRLLRSQCPDLPPLDDEDDIEKCCMSDSDPYSHTSYSEWPQTGHMLVALSVQTLVFMTLVVLTQHGVFNSLWDRLWSRALRRYRPARAAEPAPVAAEQAYVAAQLDKSPAQRKDALLIDDLHKMYYKLRRTVPAVQGISFSVKRGECFGLLGVNGAGKSTTFRMITAEECATRGRVYGAGHYLHRDRTEYLRRLGYCPQFFGLDTFLTGRENLTLVLALCGSGRGAARVAADWIATVGLQKHADARVSSYSGGCVRRLGCAAALCTPAPLGLLDEPTSGVDPAARRRVHAAVRRARRAVVVTSHSMDEMEALCGRIGIMRGGRVCALGTPAGLRAAAAGRAVRLKLTAAADEVDGGGVSGIERLKVYMLEKFQCQLKDEHRTMLHYQLSEAVPYARLFAEMERVKSDNPTVEDYSVSETSLEEVFLALANEPDQAVA